MNQIIADRRIIRAHAKSVRQIILNIEAPNQTGNERLPVNIAIALDTSESMEGKKLELAKVAIIEGLERLGPQDGFAFVHFARDAYTTVSFTQASPAAIELAKAAIETVWTGGVTNLGEGLLHAYAELNFPEEKTINRCLILTDGIANRGITETSDFVALVKAGARRNITTSTIGMGSDYDDDVLRRIALSGKGNFYRARRSQEIMNCVEQEFGESMQVGACDVSVRLDIPKGVVARVLSDYATIERAGTIDIALGDLISGQITEVIVEVEFDGLASEASRIIEVEVGESGDPFNSRFILNYELGSAEEVDAQVPDPEARFRVGQIHGALATREAVLLNRWGRHVEAQRFIMQAAQAIRERSAGDQRMKGLADELERRSLSFRKPMPEPDRKDWTSWTSISCRCVIVPAVKKRSKPPEGPERPWLKLVKEKPRAAEATLEIDRETVVGVPRSAQSMTELGGIHN